MVPLSHSVVTRAFWWRLGLAEAKGQWVRKTVVGKRFKKPFFKKLN